MNDEKLNTGQKALQINIDATKYGTFAEIGAGQETARWFFRDRGSLRPSGGESRIVRLSAVRSPPGSSPPLGGRRSRRPPATPGGVSTSCRDLPCVPCQPLRCDAWRDGHDRLRYARGGLLFRGVRPRGV